MVLCVALCQTGMALPGDYRGLDLPLGHGAGHIHWGPRRPQSRLDLFVHAGQVVRIWLQDATGFSQAPAFEIQLPDDASFVDFGDLSGDRGEEVVVLTRRGVFADSFAASSGAGADAPKAANFQRLLPPPRNPRSGATGIPALLEPASAEFLHDLNKDGTPELLVPAHGGYVLYERRGDQLQERAFLASEEKVALETGGPEVLDPLGLEVRIPRLRFKDLNGDGKLDVVARGKQATDCYLQGADGFSSEPSYRVDLERFGKEASAGEDRNPLEAGVLGPESVRVHEEDIDGDGIQDYLVAAGRRLSLFFAEKNGVEFSRPHTVLKFSSDLRGVGSFDIDGDGRRDLVALKFEMPSLPRFLAAYFVSMAMDFEVLGYRNQGGRRFSHRPDRRNQLTLRIPPLRSVVEDFDAFAARFLEQVENRQRFASGDVNGDGAADAVFLEEDNKGHWLRVFFGKDQGSLPEPSLGDILFDTAKQEWELQELLDFVASASFASQRRRVAGRPPDLEIAVGKGYDPEALAIEVLDLNDDGQGDFALRWTRESLKLFLSAAAEK